MLESVIAIALIAQVPKCSNYMKTPEGNTVCLDSSIPKSTQKKPKSSNDTNSSSRYIPMGNGLLLDTDSIQKNGKTSVSYTVLREVKNTTGNFFYRWNWTGFCPRKIANVTGYLVYENGVITENISGKYNLRSAALASGAFEFRPIEEYSPAQEPYIQEIKKSLSPLLPFNKTFRYVCSNY